MAATDVRPRYKAGDAGYRIADGVFLVDKDGNPINVIGGGGGGGGGSGDNSDVVAALEEQTDALKAPAALPVLKSFHGRTKGSSFAFDPETGPVLTPAEAVKVYPVDLARKAGGFFQNAATDDDRTVMYCLLLTPENPNGQAEFPQADGDGNPVANGTFILNAGDTLEIGANGLSVICDRTVPYACYIPTGA